MARIDQIQRRVLSDSETLTGLWRRFFGDMINYVWEETPPKKTQIERSSISKAIVQLIHEATVHLNKNAEPNRVGEASLFIREPHNDRLVMAYSTSASLREPDVTDSRIANWAENYDPVRKVLYYSLCDRLTTARSIDSSREQRGLTGWVAVAGHYLLVNGEQDSIILNLISKIRPDTSPACNRYGYPFWGHRMSEAPSDPARPKRYLGVPVKSVVSPDITIGVLRYACPLEGAELTVNDLAFLEEIATIIGALLNLEPTKVRALREADLPHQTDNLKRNGNLDDFLSFMSWSLRSQIVSAYLDIGHVLDDKAHLRLIDAVGIDGTVAKHRKKLNDYTGSDQSKKGFTWWLYKTASLSRPTVQESVVLHDSWSGRNTEIFYQSALSALGIKNDQQDIRKAVSQYRIKIMGMPIIAKDGKRIGVLKAEFPSCFDDKDHYDRDDKEFFVRCSQVVSEYLQHINDLLSNKLFNDQQDDQGVFFRAVREILRTNLLQKKEAKEFWANLGDYIKNNREQLKIKNMQILHDTPDAKRRESEQELIVAVRNLPANLPPLIKEVFINALYGGDNPKAY